MNPREICANSNALKLGPLTKPPGPYPYASQTQCSEWGDGCGSTTADCAYRAYCSTRDEMSRQGPSVGRGVPACPTLPRQYRYVYVRAAAAALASIASVGLAGWGRRDDRVRFFWAAATTVWGYPLRAFVDRPWALINRGVPSIWFAASCAVWPCRRAGRRAPWTRT